MGTSSKSLRARNELTELGDAQAGYQARWLGLAVGVLAVSFHFQATPEIAGNPIRIGAADLVAPVVGFILLFGSLRNRGALPVWRLPGLYVWLLALTGVMTIALAVGRLNAGAWIPWAVYNKYVGWFVLVGYLVFGGWSVAQAGTKTYLAMMRPFLIACWLIAGYGLIDYMVRPLGDMDLPGGSQNYRLIGFLDNPNAYGVTAAIALALQLPYVAANRLFNAHVHRITAGLLIAAIVLSLSRSAWVGTGVAVAVLLVLRSIDLRKTAISALIGSAIVLIAAFIVPAAMNALTDVLTQASSDGSSFWAGLAPSHSLVGGRLFDPKFISAQDFGAMTRVETNLLALELWRQEPVFGIGLGSFLWPQLVADAAHPVIIHSTFLWLLTETGAIGFLAFAGFFVVCARAVLRDLGSHAEVRVFLLAVVGAAAVIAGASVGMEAMYQRHLWFLAGCALALPGPVPEKSEPTDASMDVGEQ